MFFSFVKDDASCTHQTLQCKRSVAPPKDHRVGPTSRTVNLTMGHAAQTKAAHHQRPAGSSQQPLPHCNRKTPASASLRNGPRRIITKEDIKAPEKTRKPAKRPFNEDDDAIQMIRKMFK
jgi:hypothetical protein